MPALTKATVTTNGFSYAVVGMVGKENRAYHVHLGSKYGNEFKPIPQDQATELYPRPVDRLEAARIKREFTSLLLAAREI
jgi:hypothetical protein